MTPETDNSGTSAPLFDEELPGGAMWSHILKRGTTLRLTDLEGRANVSALFYNSDCPVERYNMPDTLKAQHVARLTEGLTLHSDMGRILLSVTRDTCGWHDTICGCSTEASVRESCGAGSFQERGNGFHRNGRDSFLIELGKWGLGKRDLVPNLNFFSKAVSVAAESGELCYEPGSSHPGDFVELRAEMNVLAVLNTCPHPLDVSGEYRPGPVRLTARRSPLPAADDPCRLSRPENERAFLNTERYFL